MVKATLPDGTVLEGPPDEVAEVLVAVLGGDVVRLTVASVKAMVCAMFRLTEEKLLAENRARSVAYPRMLAMYVCRQDLGMSFAEIGKEFGGRDHTTAMNAYRKIQDLLDSGDPEATQAVEQMRSV